MVGIGGAIAVTAAAASAFVFLGDVRVPQAKNCPGGVVGASIGGPFDLVDQNGAAFSSDMLKGKPSLLYFGFATCPDVCPTELADISAAVDLVKESDGIDVRPVFITIDPERDTPERVGEYVGFFHDKMIGLTGSVAAAGAAAKAYRVYYAKAEGADFPDGYTMDHSSFIYLLDEEGSFITYYKYVDTPEIVAEGLLCHLGG